MNGNKNRGQMNNQLINSKLKLVFVPVLYISEDGFRR